jgi:hypothetical protein
VTHKTQTRVSSRQKFGIFRLRSDNAELPIANVRRDPELRQQSHDPELAVGRCYFSSIPNIGVLPSRYGCDLVARRCKIFVMVEEKIPVEGWFMGFLILLGIPVLAIAYTLWDAYRVTTR